jgi:DNA-binding CsgD family transcriptional regulator
VRPVRGRAHRSLRVEVRGSAAELRLVSDLFEREGIEVARPSSNGVVDAVVLWAGDGSTIDACVERAPVVLVAAGADRRSVCDALSAGARGFVAEDDVEARLLPTVEAVACGQLVVPAEHRGAINRPLLTAREKQVMSMVVLGFTNVEIANKLYVTETTVKSHLSSAYRKLGVRSRHEATELILDSREGLGLGVLSLTPGEARAAEPVAAAL